MEPLIIARSKRKLLTLLAATFMFIAMGLWLVITKPATSNLIMNNPLVIAAAGYGGILLGLLGMVVVITQLFSNKIGMTIDSTGFLYHADAFNIGSVLWRDVVGISMFEVARTKMLIVHVSNPEQYIDMQPSTWKKKLMQLNYSNYGSPISVSAGTLNISYDALLAEMAKHTKIITIPS